MFAQVSDKASDPSSWAELFKVVGFEGGLVIVLLVVGLLVTFLIGLLGYRVANWLVGPEGWGKAVVTKYVDRQDTFLSKIEACLPGLESSNQKQLDYCQLVHAPGGIGNINDLRGAGHHFAEMGRAIGKATGAAGTDDRADTIHEMLRGDARVSSGNEPEPK